MTTLQQCHFIINQFNDTSSLSGPSGQEEFEKSIMMTTTLQVKISSILTPTFN